MSTAENHAARRREVFVYIAYNTIRKQMNIVVPKMHTLSRLWRSLLSTKQSHGLAAWLSGAKLPGRQGISAMSVGVCLIRAGLPAPDALAGLLRQCGLSVWTPATPDADDGHIYGGALCIVIDMPREAGFRTLKLFRDYGVQTPVLLIVDPGLEKATAGAERLGGIDVVSRDTDPREILRRIEALFRKRCQIEQQERMRA